MICLGIYVCLKYDGGYNFFLQNRIGCLLEGSLTNIISSRSRVKWAMSKCTQIL